MNSLPKNYLRLQVQAYDDRQAIVSALANSGYFVSVQEEHEPDKIGNKYYVLVGITDDDRFIHAEEEP